MGIVAAMLHCTSAFAGDSSPPAPTDTSYVYEIDPNQEIFPNFGANLTLRGQIGRASCRERV